MNKVLVIGAGPSMYRRLDDFRNFPGKIISCDIIAEYLLEDEKFPVDYVTTFEIKEGIELGFFDPKLIRHDFRVIWNWKAEKPLIRHFEDNGFQHESFQSYRWENVNNVGLFSCRFAAEKLKADEIYLIGFDHVGTKYTSYIYSSWLKCFDVFLKDEVNNRKIINCSGRGNLYMDGIIDGRDIKFK